MELDLHRQLAPIGEGQVLWDVVEEHLEEASFLWFEWERALESPALAPRSVAGGVERRLLAHLDGIALSGAVVPDRLARSAARTGDEGAAFAAAHALLRSASDGGATALSLLAAARGDHRRAVRRAVQLAPASGLLRDLGRLLGDARAVVRAAALDLVRVNALDPASALADALADPAPEVRCAALAVVSALRCDEHRASTVALLSAPEPAVRDAAARAGLILDLGEAREACRAAVASGAAGREVLLLLALAGSPADLPLLLAAASSADRRADALWALGFTTAAAAADTCAAATGDAALGPIAAEAFAGVTGIDLIQEGLATPALMPPADLEDADDAALELRPEASLPIPDPDRIRAFWAARRPSFAPRPTDASALAAALERAPMRRRHALATQLAIVTGGAWQIDTRGWVRSQLAGIERLRATKGAAP